MMTKTGLCIGYFDLSLRMPGPLLRTGSPDSTSMIAHFKLNNDIAQLFPYIHALSEDAALYAKPIYIKFMLDEFLCALYPDSGAAAPFNDKRHAMAFMDRLIEFLNDIQSRMDSIEPDHRSYRPVSVLDIMRLLPRTNCGDCGYDTCMVFAVAVSRKEILPDLCPGFSRPIYQNAIYPVYDRRGNLLSTVTIDIDTPKRKNGSIYSAETKSEELSELTDREMQVLRFMAKGATNTKIANTLSISPHTVKSHVVHIFNKLGVNDRTQAAVKAVRKKIV